jgi:hypothetical protein
MAVNLSYLNNKQGLEEYQKITLAHHAGQMLAFDNNYTEAKVYFKISLYKLPANNEQIKWNAYVAATVAFLDKDKETILNSKKILEKPSAEDGYCANLPFIESFILNFNKTYKEAYEAAFNL